MAIPSLMEDFRSVYSWVRSGEGRLPHMMTYCNAHGITIKVTGMLMTAIACVALIHGYKPAGITDYQIMFHHVDQETDPAAIEYASHIHLPPPPSPGPPPPNVPGMPRPPYVMPTPQPKDDSTGETLYDDKFPLWVFLASGLVIQMNYFFQNLVSPNQEVGVSFIIMFKMLGEDVTRFMKVLSIVTINYGFAAYICYPKVGNVLLPTLAPTFNNLRDSMQDMIEVSILGDSIVINGMFGGFAWDGLTTGQTLEAVMFMCLMWWYVILTTILLLNLVIAMMGFTYSTVNEQATREWRVANLQLLLRLELLSKPFTDVRSGTNIGDKYFVLTRTVEETEEPPEEEAAPKPRFNGQDEAIKIVQKYWRLFTKPAMLARRANGGKKPPPARKASAPAPAAKATGADEQQGATSAAVEWDAAPSARSASFADTGATTAPTGTRFMPPAPSAAAPEAGEEPLASARSSASKGPLGSARKGSSRGATPPRRK